MNSLHASFYLKNHTFPHKSKNYNISYDDLSHLILSEFEKFEKKL